MIVLQVQWRQPGNCTSSEDERSLILRLLKYTALNIADIGNIGMEHITEDTAGCETSQK